MMKRLFFIFSILVLFVILTKMSESQKPSSEKSVSRFEVAQQHARQEIISEGEGESTSEEALPSVPVAQAAFKQPGKVLQNDEARRASLDHVISQIELPDFSGVPKEMRRNPHGTPKQVVQFAMQSSLIMKEIQTRTLTQQELRKVQDFYSDCSLAQGLFQEAPASIQLLCMTNLN